MRARPRSKQREAGIHFLGAVRCRRPPHRRAGPAIERTYEAAEAEAVGGLSRWDNRDLVRQCVLVIGFVPSSPPPSEAQGRGEISR